MRAAIRHVIVLAIDLDLFSRMIHYTGPPGLEPGTSLLESEMMPISPWTHEWVGRDSNPQVLLEKAGYSHAGHQLPNLP